MDVSPSEYLRAAPSMGEQNLRKVAPLYAIQGVASRADVISTAENYLKFPKERKMLPTTPKERKEYPIATGFLDYFPRACAAVAHLSFIGNQQHNPGLPLHWDRSKSTDEDDALMRHFLKRNQIDVDGIPERVKVAWRAMAGLEKWLEQRGQPAIEPRVSTFPDPTLDVGGGGFMRPMPESVHFYEDPGFTLSDVVGPYDTQTMGAVFYASIPTGK